ncbi:MAG: DUF3833 domain-containing protein [Colwelliaceae bacterium]|nr:DUF3833 domain-containing protein [Colwelliaceae bacterium]
MILFQRLFLMSMLLILVSCSADVSEYKSTSPKFDIKTYFSGELIAWGMVQEHSSKVTRRFCVELEGTWKDNEGTLEEVFYFQDGEISYRTWHLTKLPNDEYIGGAEDVPGVAKGKQMGFAFHWQYQLLVPIDGDTYTFDMDDWMYQLDEYRVFNKTTMSKLGFDVAKITLFFDKSHSRKSCR